MSVQIEEITPTQLSEYAAIPSRFWVRSVLQPEFMQNGLEGIRLHEMAVAEPYIKDYDAYGETPIDWTKKKLMSIIGDFSWHNSTVTRLERRQLHSKTQIYLSWKTGRIFLFFGIYA